MILARVVRFNRALRVQRNVAMSDAFLAGRCAALGVGVESRPVSALPSCSGVRWI